MEIPRQRLAEQYRKLREDIFSGCVGEGCAAAPLPEMQVQARWAAGLLPHLGTSLRHGEVRILEHGRWNRCAGPDFTHAEIELAGKRLRGDIEIDPSAQDWERHGHGANPAFNNVVLHVVLTPPPNGWYTRNSLHQDIPILYIPPHAIDSETAAGNGWDETIPRCRMPLADMDITRIDSLLRAAAAHRLEHKRGQFRQRIAAAGEKQAWYEAWATTLGYSANKEAMQMLAMRAPIAGLGVHAESILLGTAGFLVPVLPERASTAAREYHRGVWDSWWTLREQYELAPQRSLTWSSAPARPLNHPQRRVAALAASVLQWRRISPLLCASSARELTTVLSSISHPFWDTHYTLASGPIRKRTALVGSQRISDFLINHVFVQDESPHAWQSYLALNGGPLPGSIQRTVRQLFGERNDLRKLLRHAYAQQALLQIDADFCARNICQDCAFPTQLCQWAD
ncbi:MAG: DUF2851 family protein [Akkermansia sp.]|nr:DUF2851 family protein [Akkermansia sp.]